MNAKERRAAKRAEVRHNPKHVGRPPKIGVERGHGPRHAANSKEGDEADLTQINTDTVPAMLTPREAVLNRNAAEMAGRGNIEALNERGNELAKNGVDLAGGENDMNKSRQKLQGGGYAGGGNPLKQRRNNPFGEVGQPAQWNPGGIQTAGTQPAEVPMPAQWSGGMPAE